MTRYSFTKRPITPKDIPDPDCPHSHFDTCVFKGDFSAYDWRDCDFIDCKLAGVTALPAGEKLDYIYSRRSLWPVSIIPHSISLRYSHDIVAAWAKRRAAQLTGAEQKMAVLLGSWCPANYDSSVANFFWEVKQQENVTGAQVKEIAKRMCAPAPRLLKIVEGFHAEEINTLPDKVRVSDLASVVYSGGKIDVSGDLTITKDRWKLARHLESVHPDLRFWVAQIEPSPVILASHRRVDLEPDYEGWWWTAMWVV
ncbi:hypothetical protein LCGC14_2244410 [marine sediment metagenome]|uniref:Uncharacterized protein n=1 Tax=marine sediment metagenome TaxID=412755 RepID=A0A0F9D470_9ZZZZ